jgi:hypothetical protein
MRMHAKPALALVLATLVAACANDYDKFSFDDASSSSGSNTGGAATTAPLECDGGQIDCSGTCTDVRSDARCGGCDNDCTAQGLACVAGSCGCSEDAQCDGGTCLAIIGRCQCGTEACRRGENCDGGACSCNGAAACDDGMTCCQSPEGCFDLDTDRDNCGACGLRCGPGQHCVAGLCK